jgi:hypothetical protein
MTYEASTNFEAKSFQAILRRSSCHLFSNGIREQKQQEKHKPGHPAKLSLEDQVLLTLQYWREYRTYFHIAQC